MELFIAQCIASWRTAIELFFRTRAGKLSRENLGKNGERVFEMLLEALMPIPETINNDERTTIESWKKVQHRSARSTFFSGTGEAEPSVMDVQRFDAMERLAEAQVPSIIKIAKQHEQAQRYGGVRTPMVPVDPETMLPRSEQMTLPHYYDPEYLREIARQVEAETGRKILKDEPVYPSEPKPPAKEAIPPPPGSVSYTVCIRSISEKPEACDEPPETQASPTHHPSKADGT